MRAAIRGDFERLELRRGAQELMQVMGPEPEEAEPELAQATEPVLEVEEVHADGASEPHPRSWLARLFGTGSPRQV